MKLLRYGPRGQERPALLDDAGRIRDLSGHLHDIAPECLSPAKLMELSRIDWTGLPVIEGTPRLGVPVAGVGKIVAVGLNYVDHAVEAGLPIPNEPIIFLKAVTALSGPHDTVILPRSSVKGDWEVELGIVMGSRASYVNERDALDHVAGYCVANDVSEREYQIERSGTWDKGKGCDTFAPVGPWLVTADEVGDPQNLDMWLDLNGQRMQTGNTRTMIFGCAALVSYISQFMTLMPGDIIITGTPPGVGMGMKPNPVFLKPGDVMTLGIEKLGIQRQNVVAWNEVREVAA